MIVYTSQQKQVRLKEETFGRGGQGNIYEVVANRIWKGYVAKIYHAQERTKKRHFKLHYMWQHPPVIAEENSVVWVEELLYDAENQFLGYLMKKAEGEVNLTALCSLSMSGKLEDWQEQYSRETREGFANRIIVCKNLADTLHRLHQTGNYVLVDIKPENIRVERQGQIALLDLDSIEIKENEQLLFAADKLTHEYSPPEIQRLDFHKQLIPETWDRFSMAVVFYKVLFGLHPFTGTCRIPYQGCTTYTQKIQKALFPFGEAAEFFEVIPAPQQRFKYLSTDLQWLFMQCFEVGHSTPDRRPSAIEWQEAFSKKSRFFSEEFLKRDKRQKKRSSKTGKSSESLYSGNTMFFMICFLLLFGFSIVWRGYQLYNDYRLIADMNTACKIIKNEEGKYGFENVEEKIRIPCTFDSVINFQDGLAKVKVGNQWGMIDKEGEKVLPIMYNQVWNTKGSRILALLGDSLIVMNRQGNVLTSYFDFEGWEDGLGRVKSNTLVGYINQQGIEVIPCIYEYVGKFSGDWAMAKSINGSWGLIDKKNTPIIPFKYEKAEVIRAYSRNSLSVFRKVF